MSNVSSIPLPAAHALRKLGRDLALARRKRGNATSDMAAPASDDVALSLGEQRCHRTVAWIIRALGVGKNES